MKNIVSIIILSLGLFFSSCDNDAFLKIQQPQEFGWQNMTELEYAAVSPYKNMFYGGYSASLAIIVTNQVMMSDYFRFLGNVEGYSTDQFYNRKFSQRIPELEGLYTSLYTTIGLTNNGLNFVLRNNGNPFLSADSTEIKEVKRIRGELHFMRAYAYYQLATNFCPAYIAGGANDSKILVKRDSVVLNSISALNNSPVTTSEIYDLMVSDLKKAKAFLPVDWATGMNVAYKNRARANKWAASALLAQVYFTMGKFGGTESAMTEYNDIIANGGYSLNADPFANFNNQSTTILKSENSEVIFWAFYADQRLLDAKQSTKMHEALRYTHFNKCGRDAMNGGNGNLSNGTSPKWSIFMSWIQMVMSKNALTEMGWINADGTETNSAKWDKRYYNPGTDAAYLNQKGLFYRFEGAYTDLTAYTTAKGGSAQLGRRKGASDDGKFIVDTKFAGLIATDEPTILVNKYYRSADGKIQNIPVIRLAEIYLNRAMCKLKTGQTGAEDDFNMVAARAWNTTLGGAYTPKTGVTERDVLVQRWKELAGEDAWYVPFCEACGFTIGAGNRADNSTDLVAPYSSSYWSNSIPLSEIDFQKKIMN